MNETRLYRATLSAALFIWVISGNAVQGEITTFSSEGVFARKTGSSGPFNAPFSGATNKISVEAGLFEVKPGPGLFSLAVSNVIDNKLPTDLCIEGVSPSDFDFSIPGGATTFGFMVHSVTGPGYNGTSRFHVALFKEGKEVGTASFEASGSRETFFGLQSTQPFDLLALREVDGGPQNAKPAGGLADREYFGKFYTNAERPREAGEAPGVDGNPAPVFQDAPLEEGSISSFSLTFFLIGLALFGFLSLAVGLIFFFARRESANPPS